MFEQYIANNYLRAALVFAILLILLRIIASVLARGILKFVKKTKTDLDDVLIQKSSLPITIILIL
jgi:hypothetical protein